MILLELTTKDFRQFAGEQSIEFAQPGQRNVTVLHGFNGAGKTALLNAFVWCLYGETTPDFEGTDKLLNESARAVLGVGQNCDLFVQLKFSNVLGEVYVARRSVTVSRTGDEAVVEGDAELSLGVHRQSGEYDKLSGGQLYINRELPKSLYPFFFFNGERVEALAKKDAYDQVEGGVKTLLNVEIFEQAVKHLKGRGHSVAGLLKKELQNYSTQELNDLLEEEEKSLVKQGELEDDLQTQVENIAALDEEIERIESRQASIKELTELIERSRGLNKLLKQASETIKQLEGDKRQALSKDGYLGFADPILSKTQQLVSEARQRGDLPAKLKPQFVDDLIERGDCICGRPILASSPEYACLQKWRESTGLAELEECIAQTSGAIPGLHQRRHGFYSRIDSLQEQLDSALAQKQRLMDELGDVEAQIDGRSVDEESSALQAKRMRAVGELSEAQRREKEVKSELEDLETWLTKLGRDRARLETHDKKGALIQKQIGSVERVASVLEAIANLQKQDVRRSLNKHISSIWEDAAVKDYAASLSESFRLELHKTVAGARQLVQGASTGERQVLGLSFVGALVRKARDNAERAAKDPAGLIVGSDYPLVMDSPFGSLEKDYQRKIAQWIPTLAGQVVVMASKSQWSANVESAIRPRVGREYVLELHTPKEGVEQPIEILGSTYAYVVETTDGFEKTEIREAQ